MTAACCVLSKVMEYVRFACPMSTSVSCSAVQYSMHIIHSFIRPFVEWAHGTVLKLRTDKSTDSVSKRVKVCICILDWSTIVRRTRALRVLVHCTRSTIVESRVSGDTVETDGTVETDKRTEKHVTDDLWVTCTVESKQERKAKRMQSCLNTGKTRSVSRMNGRSGFRVKFGDSSDSLILI